MEEKGRAYGGVEVGGQKEGTAPSSLQKGMDRVRRRLLLHSCCGPCSTAVIERLVADYDLCVFYYNPCITDEEEYRKRREEQIRFIQAFNRDQQNIVHVSYLDGDYDPNAYLALVKGWEAEPEGGRRCEICFRMRLTETARMAKSRHFPLFTTTLSVSPHKDFACLARVGKEVAARYGVEFLAIDFKKKAGFQRSVQLARAYGLYRQNYCGCRFSKRDGPDLSRQEQADSFSVGIDGWRNGQEGPTE